MVVGLMSHLQGGGFTRPADRNHVYPWGIECCSCGAPSDGSQCKTQCTSSGCSGRFAALMGIGTSNVWPDPDPFQETLAPEPAKYCK